MTDIKYIDIIKNSHDHHWIRKKIVDSEKKIGVKPTARKYHCSVNTVKKWRDRYKLAPRKKLVSKSKKPHSNPKTMDIYWEATIVTTCEEFATNQKRLNSALLKKKFDIPYSSKSVRKVMIKHGHAKLNKRKSVRKVDLWAIKKKMKAFQKIQVDVKYLDDIPELYREYVVHKLPKYQYTARCVKTGALFICYGRQLSTSNAATFIHLLANHLKKHRVKLWKTTIQTDNGVEFTQGWNYTKKSNFTKAVELYGMRHKRIPPKACTFNSDVETSHRLIEDEFYSFESFNSKLDFLTKAHEYQKEFNFKRNNSHKDNKTPVLLLTEESGGVLKKVLDFPPLVLDTKMFDARLMKVA